jgi:serine/threonine protein kinase
VKVGEYEVIRRIGHGAYGKVYLARRGDPGGFRTYYALKRLRLEHSGEEAFEHYLLREARHGGLVNHRSLVRIHGVLRWEGEYVLVMDFADGVTLRQVLGPRRTEGDAIPREVALEIAAETLEALHYIHNLVDPEGRESGFVHRDVKPGNIMLTRAGGLKLMDFGVARGDDPGEAATQVGELRGTIAYMAPEQAAGDSTGPAADQFAVGLVLLEMLTATPAWGDPRASGILAKVVQGDVSEGLVRLEATDPVCGILMRMLQPEPSERFPDTGEAAVALRALRAQIPLPPALPAFSKREIDRIRGASSMPGMAVPSWTDSEDSVGSSGTWSKANAPPGAPPDAVQSPSPVHTLPLGQRAVSAMEIEASTEDEDYLDDLDDLLDAEELELSDDEPTDMAPPPRVPPQPLTPLPPLAPPPPLVRSAWPGDLEDEAAALNDPAGSDPRLAVGGQATAPRGSGALATVPLGTHAAPTAAPPRPAPPPPIPAGAASTIPPVPPGASSTHWTEKTLPWSGQGQPPTPAPPAGPPPGPATAAPPGPAPAQSPPRIPGGPLPPHLSGQRNDGLPRTEPEERDLLSHPGVLGGVALLAVLLIAGVVWVTVQARRPDPGPLVDPIEDVASTLRPQPTAAPRPTPFEAELPGSASVLEMEIVDAEDPTLAVEPKRSVADEPEFDRREQQERATPPLLPPPSERRDLPSETQEPRSEAGTKGTGQDGGFVEHDRREVEAATGGDLEEGMIVGEEPRTREAEGLEPRPVDGRRSDGEASSDRGGEPATAATSSDSAEPTLRFVSAGVQPLGVPLSLRVRADGFLANGVSVYYQWRGEGRSGRRKRDLRRQGDGSFALEIPASELREDRLQLWFVAEPGGVRAGSEGRPIEVKVR